MEVNFGDGDHLKRGKEFLSELRRYHNLAFCDFFANPTVRGVRYCSSGVRYKAIFLPITFFHCWPFSMVKRTLDIFFSFLGLVLLAPVIFVVAFYVRRKLGSPVLFRQLRPGKNGKPFELIKFRTMKNISDESGVLLADSDRLTPLGSFLRSTSLDELPELWNVLKGDMSLVGPRPLLTEYLPLYTAEQLRRHEVRPGVTGWAQVNGRNALDWEAKFRLDVWYVDNRSLWLDIKVIFITIKKVLIREGISADGEATISKFTGTGQEKSYGEK